MALLDHLGRPVDLSKLTQEIAAPTIASARQIVAGHPADGLTPARLAAILRQAEAGDPLAYFELAEQMEEKDLHYLSVLGTRKRQVSQLEITVEAASNDADDQLNADLVSEWLQRDTLEDDMLDILDAVGKGFSVNEIVWSMSEKQWWPDRIEFVDPRFIRFDPVTGRQPLLLGEDGQGHPLDPFKYVFHRVRAKSGLPVRSGLARPVAWAWMFKNYGVKDWVAFAEVYGMPLRLGRYESGASREDKRILLRAVADIGADAAAIVPKSMDIEFIDGKGGSADGGLYKSMAEWFDFQVSKAVLGQTATTDAVTGGLGSGKEHNDVRGDIERADAKGIASTLGRDIARPLIDTNRGPPRSGKYPRVMVGRAEAWNPETMMPAIKTFVDLGGRVAKSVIGDRLGVPEAAPEEEVLTPAAAGVTDPQGVPQDGQPAPGARQPPAQTPRPASQASQGFSRGRRVATAAAAPPPPSAPDAIDSLIEEVVGDGEWLMAPMASSIDAILASASTLEEARDLIAAAADRIDLGEFTERLARSAFAARLAGQAGQSLQDDETQA